MATPTPEKQSQLEIPPLLSRLGLTSERLAAMDPDRLREVVRGMQSLAKRARTDGPQTDDELHTWIKTNLRVDVPRVAVCPDHDPPFKMIADCYFERLHVVIDGKKMSVEG